MWITKVGDLQELSLFINKVSRHQLNEVGILLGILGVVHDIPDGIKEGLVFCVQPVVEHAEGCSPDVGPWHFVGIGVQLGFVIEVSVDDVLHEPVLGPVSISSRDGVLKGVEPLEEGLVLEGVLLAVIVGLGGAEEAPLVVKVSPHLRLQVGQMHCALWSVSQLSDVVEQNLVLIVDPSIEDLDTVIPVIRLGHVVGQQVDVLEVGVLDVLHQPVLRPRQLRLRHRGRPLVKPAKEGAVLAKMVVDVSHGHGLLEEALLQCEVVMVLHICFLDVCLGVLTLDLQDGVEESTVFIVDLGVFDSERLVPPVRFGHWEDHL